jgi:septal ring factor EnvC (AmiA/AmiB activator)
MSNVNSRIILFSFFCFAFTLVKAQSSSSKLKKEQERLEAKISDTKSLLNKTKNNTEASLSELKLIESQIKFREELVANFDSQIRAADKEVSKKQKDIVELRLKLEEMKEQYKKMLLYAYKHRNKYGEMMQIISSESFYEAKKRKKYIEKLAALQEQQVFIIQQNEELLKNEIAFIEEEKQRKLAVLLEKKKEKESILQDKSKQQEVYQKFKNKEAELIVELQEDELKKEDLKDRINKAIRKEIEQANKKAEEEALKRKKAKEAAKKKEKERLAALAEKSKDNSGSDSPESPSMESIIFKDVNENIALDKNFQANRGKLPWPVEKGTITESFGKNAHPTLENVFTNNSGIDITAPRSAQVRAVFEGEVTSILNIPGAGKVVIIKHGNYRTVYTNLQNTYVSAGMKVDTKQAIGSLIVSTNSQFSIAHFEIHQVIENNVQCINPILWINN